MVLVLILVLPLIVIGEAMQDTNCYAKSLRFNQSNSLDNNFYAPKNTNWYKIEIKSFYHQCEITFENHSIGDSAVLEIYEDIFCDTPNVQSLSTELLDQNSKTINLNSYSPGEYYILIKSDYKQRGAYTLNYKGKFVPEGCHYEVNHTNSARRPHKIAVDYHSVNICFSGCNRYVKPGNRYYTYQHQFDSEFKWYELETEIVSAFLDLDVLSTQGEFELLVARRNETGKIRIIEKSKSYLYHTNIGYLPVPGDDVILFGVRPLSQDELDFTACVKLRPYDDSCIDYLTEGDTLYPISTSLGSPLEGPYMQGEVIDFVYKINQWRPIDYAWLHSVQPTVSGSWNFIYDTTHTDSLINWSITNENDSLKHWDWYYQDSTQVYSALNNRFLGPGWYIRHNARGPQGIAPKLIWGESMESYEAPPTPFMQISFQLKVNDSLDCNGLNISTISIQSRSDYESGYYFGNGCINQPEIFQCTTQCCPNAPLVGLKDSLICDNQYLVLEVEGLTEGEGHFYSQGILTQREVGNGDNGYLLTAGNDSLRNFKGIFAYNYKDICFDTTQMDFAIAPEPNIELGRDLEVCPGAEATIKNQERNDYQEVDMTWMRPLSRETMELQPTSILHLPGIYNPDMVSLEGVNSYGCFNSDTVIIDIIRLENRILTDYEICPSKLDSVIEIDKISNNCETKIIKPDNSVIASNKVTLDQVGKYMVEFSCEQGCGQVDSFEVTWYNPYDTIYVKPEQYAALDQLNSSPIGLRSITEKKDPCSRKKDTIYIIDYKKAIVDNDVQYFSLYPNPSNGNITINNFSEHAGVFRLIDKYGVEHYPMTNISSQSNVNINGLSQGVYYFLCDINHQSKVLKLVVNE